MVGNAVQDISSRVGLHALLLGLYLYFTFLIFILVVESESIACQINRTSEKITKPYLFFESDDGGDDNIKIVSHTKSMMLERKVIKVVKMCKNN